MMSPFEAHVLVQQGDTLSSTSSSSLEAALTLQHLNPNTVFKQETLLATAIKSKSPNLLQLFLQYGADPNLKSYENGRYEPALITAVRYKSLGCVQILLEHGANMKRTNFYGTDAIFQAVYENAFEILDYLLSNTRTKRKSPVSPSCRSSHQRGRHYVKPAATAAALQSISLIQRETTSKKEATKPRASSEQRKPRGHSSSNNRKEQDDGDSDDGDDHLLCPFSYALRNAISLSCKRLSLRRLLQANYQCRCVQEIASCCCNNENEKFMERVAVVDSCVDGNRDALHGLLEEKKGVTGTVAEAGECLKVLEEAFASVLDGKSVAFLDTSTRVGVGNGNSIKLPQAERSSGERGFGSVCPYKIFKIKEKGYAIKENDELSTRTNGIQPLPSSYVILLGPFTLSSITREVIRNQIRLCSSYSYRANNATFESQSQSKQQQMQITKQRQVRSFRESLDTLMIPPSLKNFILYENINDLSNDVSKVSSIKLIKENVPMNVKYYAVFI